MEDERLAEEQAQAGAKKKRKFKNPFKKRPKTREEKIEAWLENQPLEKRIHETFPSNYCHKLGLGGKKMNIINANYV